MDLTMDLMVVWVGLRVAWLDPGMGTLDLRTAAADLESDMCRSKGRCMCQTQVMGASSAVVVVGMGQGLQIRGLQNLDQHGSPVLRVQPFPLLTSQAATPAAQIKAVLLSLTPPSPLGLCYFCPML